MKTIIVFIIIVFATNSTNAIDTAADSKDLRFSPTGVIHQLFELARKLIVNGDYTNGIPVMDPLIGNFEVNRINRLLSFDLRISNGSFTGLGRFKLTKSLFNKQDLSIGVCLEFPALVLKSGSYEMSGTIFKSMPMAGKGVLLFKINNLNISGNIYIKQSENGRSILLDKFEDINYSIEKITSQTDFDGNIDEIVNAMVADMLADYVNRFQRYILRSNGERAILALNPYLALYETWRFITVLL